MNRPLELIKSLENSQTRSRQVTKLEPRRQRRKELLKRQKEEKRARLTQLRSIEKTAS